MNKGKTEVKDKLDLKLSMECGQTFLWNKYSGKPLYEDTDCKKFYKVSGDDIVVLWEEGSFLKYKGTLKEGEIKRLLNLNLDIKQIERNISKDGIIKEAIGDFKGLRILNDEFFPCLVSYIISTRMRIPRIKKMVNSIAKRYGKKLKFDGRRFYSFPTPEELSEATVEELKEIGLGYRSKYVKKTTEQILNKKVEKGEVRKKNYLEAREELKKLMGAGNKVADCVLLFSLGFHEAYPLDTWGKKVIKNVYPRFHDSRYWKVSENMRSYFGDYAGWAHEYLFHWARENQNRLES